MNKIQSKKARVKLATDRWMTQATRGPVPQVMQLRCALKHTNVLSKTSGMLVAWYGLLTKSLFLVKNAQEFLRVCL